MSEISEIAIVEYAKVVEIVTGTKYATMHERMGALHAVTEHFMESIDLIETY